MKVNVVPAGLLVFLFLSGCAFGPLATQETARTVGELNTEFIGGYGNTGYLVKWNIGAMDNLDIGIQLESLSMGLRAKYAFVNGKDKMMSYAGAVGLGTTAFGKHYYGDLMASYLHTWWEPYANVRVVHVITDPIRLASKSVDGFDWNVSVPEFNYGQIFLGSRFWLDPNWMLTLEGSTFMFMSNGVTVTGGALVNLALGYRVN